MNQWSEWINFLELLKDIKILRCYIFQLFKVINIEIYIFFDVLEKVIGVVVYLKICFLDNSVSIGFLIGKVKLVLIEGYFLFRLELCVVVMVIEIYEIIRELFDIKFDSVKFYIDS